VILLYVYFSDFNEMFPTFCRFIYADYALASAVAHLSPRGPVPFGLTYDVWCHWIANFRRRAENLPPSIALPQNFDLIGAIPKFHLPGHDQSCYVRWSLDHTQYVGRMEGEGPERVWSHVNQHSGSTSEQGPGVRTDTINNLAYEWNYEKMIRMGKYILIAVQNDTDGLMESASSSLEVQGGEADVPAAEGRPRGFGVELAAR
jgi:hypothetical protein